MQLLAYAYILSLMTLVLDVMQLYFLPPCITCDKVHASHVHGIGNNWDPIGKGKGLNTCYSAAYMSQTHDQQAAALYNLGRGS